VRNSVELTWRNSEFSFFRLQYSHDDPTRTTTDNALFLQYDVSLGSARRDTSSRHAFSWATK
jgi:hypothetical protein